jgi:hypothetical protein
VCEVHSDPPTFDTSVPHPARVYDYWLGGKDNFAADRETAEAAIKAFPNTALSARANRAFLGRVVSFLAGEAGISQFLDIGTGLPTAGNTHEVAQSLVPESRVVYVDNDPIVLSHSAALLTDTSEGTSAYIHGDLRAVDTIVEQAAATLDYTRPVAVVLVAVLHFVLDPDEAYGIVAQLMSVVPPGSYLAISHLAKDIRPEEMAEFVRQMNARASADAQCVLRTREEVTRFFDGLDLVEPGVVSPPHWRPRSELEAASPCTLWGGVARKP